MALTVDLEEVRVLAATEPPPRDSDIQHYQNQLNGFAGFTGIRPNLRVVWAGNLFEIIDGEPRLQYTYPEVREMQVKVARRSTTNPDGTVSVDEIELPYDESRWEECYEDLKSTPIGVRNYLIEVAVRAWCIQALVPARITEKNRNDSVIDVSQGRYEHVLWCTSDGTDLGDQRPVVDADIAEVRALWRERELRMPGRHDTDENREFWRRLTRDRQARKNMDRRLARRRAMEPVHERIQSTIARHLGTGKNRVFSLPQLGTRRH